MSSKEYTRVVKSFFNFTAHKFPRDLHLISAKHFSLPHLPTPLLTMLHSE